MGENLNGYYSGLEEFINKDYSNAYPEGLPKGFDFNSFHYNEVSPGVYKLYKREGEPYRLNGSEKDIRYDKNGKIVPVEAGGLVTRVRQASSEERKAYESVLNYRKALKKQLEEARELLATRGSIVGPEVEVIGTYTGDKGPVEVLPVGTESPDLTEISEEHKRKVAEADARVREATAFEKPLNFLSLGQWFGAGIDYLQGETNDFFGSIYNGNSGWLTDNFARENPRAASFFNFVGDLAIPYSASKGISYIPRGYRSARTTINNYGLSKAMNRALNDNVFLDIVNNPMFRDVGNVTDYINYVDNIFPESRIKGVQWHGGNATRGTLKASRVDPEVGNMEGFYTTPNKSYASTYGLPHPVILDMKNPLETTGSWTGILDDVTSISKQGYDGIINRRFNTNPLQPANPENITFNPELVHFLGDQTDLIGFKRDLAIRRIYDQRHNRMKVGDVEINDPNLNYRQGGAGTVQDFLDEGVVLAKSDKAPEIKTKSRNGTGRVYLLTKEFDEPMFKQGGLWYDSHLIERPWIPPTNSDLLVTREPLQFSNQHGRAVSKDFGGRRIPFSEEQLTLENTTPYIWEDNYGFRRIPLFLTPIIEISTFPVK